MLSQLQQMYYMSRYLSTSILLHIKSNDPFDLVTVTGSVFSPFYLFRKNCLQKNRTIITKGSDSVLWTN